MNRIKQISLISFVISGVCLAFGFYSVELWLITSVIVVYRLSFRIGNSKNFNWSATIIFIFDFVFLTIGIFMAVPPILLTAGLVCSLISWDLEGYRHRFENKTFHGKEIEHAQRHLKRLVLAGCGGGILAILSLPFHIKPGFGSIVLFSVVSVLGLVIGMQLARRSI